LLLYQLHLIPLCGDIQFVVLLYRACLGLGALLEEGLLQVDLHVSKFVEIGANAIFELKHVWRVAEWGIRTAQGKQFVTFVLETGSFVEFYFGLYSQLCELVSLSSCSLQAFFSISAQILMYASDLV